MSYTGCKVTAPSELFPRVVTENVKLELEGEEFTVDTVVVSPLTSEAILGLDFLQEQQALIDLASKRLSLRSKGCIIPLTDPALPHACTEVLVRMVRTVEVPPHSVMEVDGRLDAPVEGVWLLQEASDKRLQVTVACALVKPASLALPVRRLNASAEPVTVYAGTTLATLEGVEAPEGAVNAVSSGELAVSVTREKQDMLWGLAEELGPDLSPGEK